MLTIKLLELVSRKTGGARNRGSERCFLNLSPVMGGRGETRAKGSTGSSQLPPEMREGPARGLSSTLSWGRGRGLFSQLTRPRCCQSSDTRVAENQAATLQGVNRTETAEA